MVSDAESHAEDDRRLRELAEARNNGENAAYQAERQLKELGETVDESSKGEIEAAIKAVRDALTSEDAADINAKTEALQASFHKVSEAMYQRAQEQAAAAATAPRTARTGPARRRRGGRRRRRGRGGDAAWLLTELTCGSPLRTPPVEEAASRASSTGATSEAPQGDALADAGVASDDAPAAPDEQPRVRQLARPRPTTRRRSRPTSTS